jgi:hypothetical protein
VFATDGGIKNDIEDYPNVEDNESAASMSDEEDDDGDKLKEFLSTQGRDKFLSAKRTRKIRLENSVIKHQMRTKRKANIDLHLF